MASTVGYVTPVELCALLRADAPSTRVVDVREGDRVHGCIRGSLSAPAWSLQDDAGVDTLVKATLGDARVSRVVFHCHFSQQRGPAAAAAFARRLGRLGATIDGGRRLQVLILSGGWRGWYREYGSDATLTQRLPGGAEGSDE